MNKKLLTAFALLTVMVFSGGAWAQTVCMNVSGNLLELVVIGGSGGHFAVAGSNNGDRPVSGTAVAVPGGYNIGVGLVQAGALNAVVWELNVDASLNGTGFYRWYNGVGEGPVTVTSVACPVAAEATDAADSLAAGIQ